MTHMDFCKKHQTYKCQRCKEAASVTFNEFVDYINTGEQMYEGFQVSIEDEDTYMIGQEVFMRGEILILFRGHLFISKKVETGTRHINLHI